MGVEHGLANTYSNWGCRCDLCKQAEHERYLARKKREAQA